MWLTLLFFLFPTLRAEPVVQRELLGQAEIFYAQPEGAGPWPALLMLHPQGFPQRIGAALFVKNGALLYWARKGYVAMAISQPGYGQTPGPGDFCGPKSQQQTQDAIAHLRALPQVRKDKVFLYGSSRGGLLASLIAAQDPALAGVMIKAGLYDPLSFYKELPWYSYLRWLIIWEIGFFDPAKMKARSGLEAAPRIKAPLLLFHGTADDRIPFSQAENFAAKVRSGGGQVRLLPLDDDHSIPMRKINAEMGAFMKGLVGK